MEENRFFKFVWRFNGLALMIAGILAIGLLLVAGFIMIKEMSRNDIPTNIINVQQETNSTEILELGHLRSIQGSSCVVVSLTSEPKGQSKSFGSSYSSSSVKNYLFINNKNNTQSWLFKDNKFLIHSMSFLPEDEYNKNDQDVEAILYRIVKDDSNNDKSLSRRDLQTIALSLPDGTKYREVIDGIDNFIGQKLIEKDILLIMYQKKGIGFFTKINIKTLSVSKEVELSKVGL